MMDLFISALTVIGPALNKTAPLGKGKFLGGIQPEVISSQCSRQLWRTSVSSLEEGSEHYITYIWRDTLLFIF
jgi:hypothetical protein